MCSDYNSKAIMNKEVKYSGYSAVPSDYESKDGELAMSLNLLQENGTLSPVRPPALVRAFPEGQAALFIHETTGYKHYIVCESSSSKLLWIDSNSGSGELGYISNVSHCNAVGNTLLVFTDSAINYFYWKDNAYVSLGNHIPEIPISFGLVGHPRLFSVSDSSKSTFNISFAEGLSMWDIYTELSENNKTKVTEQIMAKVNKFIREQSIDKGRFCFPFFVRYALRLYDGSLVCHSAPILMNPQTLPAPLVLWKRATGKDSYTDAECDIMLVACDLDYRPLRALGEIYKLSDWSDIISGIEVFVSKPIYTYDQEGKISSLRDTDNFDTTFIGRISHKSYHSGGAPQYPTTVTEDCVLGPFADNQTTAFLDCYAEWEYKRLYALYFSADRSYPSSTFHLPEFPDDKIGESLRNCSQFYKLCTLSLDDMKNTDRKAITLEKDYLQSLVTREVMTDDYLSHDPLSALSSQVYNSRLNLSGVKRKLFSGFSPSSMFAFTDRFIGTWQINDEGKLYVQPSLFADNVQVTIYVKEGGRTFSVSASGECGAFLSPKVQRNGADVLLNRSTGCYIFYPNVNAVTAVISSMYGESGSPYGGGSMVVQLKAHEFLNGAFALLDFNAVREHNYSSSLVPSISQVSYNEMGVIDCGSKVYTSEVNNPFYFPVTGINTVGTGRILGIATAAKALSQGQFGQFPLYAFTSDGVWALEVSATGSYSAKQPITRDVCINTDGITQIDSAVLFPTDRGIMLISGSQTQCISEPLNSEHPFDVLSLPGMEKLHQMLGHDADTCLPTRPFSQFLAKCGMVYDYVLQRIVVFNPDFTYAYVYSLKTQSWGMMYSDVKATINSYPEALAVNGDGNLVDFTQEKIDDDGRVVSMPCLLVTRPLKLDAPDFLKTVTTVFQRGRFATGHVSSVLYGSRNLSDWHLIRSSKEEFLRGFRGTPYKYFRIALLCNLDPGENIYSASIEFEPRLTNKMR